MRQSEKNRSRQEIMRDILATLEQTNLSKTKVMYRASLSYTQLRYYEDYLQSNKLIEITEDAELWVLTEKGRRYLQACKIADQILRMPTDSASFASTEDEVDKENDLMAPEAGTRPIRQ